MIFFRVSGDGGRHFTVTSYQHEDQYEDHLEKSAAAANPRGNENKWASGNWKRIDLLYDHKTTASIPHFKEISR